MIIFQLLFGCGEFKPIAIDESPSLDSSTDSNSIAEPEVPPSEPSDTPDTSDSDTQDSADTGNELAPPRLIDLWEGRAEFSLDESTGPFGGDFSMHFPSFVNHESQIWAFYISNTTIDGSSRSSTGLAVSDNGVDFTNEGEVLPLGGEAQHVYSPVDDFYHLLGRQEGLGWAASTGIDLQPGYMSYGPYATDLMEGPQTVFFRLRTDNNTADTFTVATIDVYDSTSGQILAIKDISRNEFLAPSTDQNFSLSYDQELGQSMEFRVFWHGNAYIRLDTVYTSQGHPPFSDDRLASFPDVWKDGDEWYMVYEAAGTDAEWPGDVSLASSSDGRTWVKDPLNPILRHADGWEQSNIGTPSLWKVGNTWYLFYHGFDGQDVQVGVATGSDLRQMNRVGDGPILPTSESGWDSGTVGARAILFQDGWYWMAFEGSSDPPFNQANWSTGIARSLDLLTWEKFSGNPVLPITSSSFGYDGPVWLESQDGPLYLYFRDPRPNNQSYRMTLQWTSK